jgi:membrane protein DedA with SNARE-associated domain
VESCRRLTERFGTPLILVFRFLYGLRTVLPFVWGTSQISTLRFFLLDLVGAGLWALAVGTAGYFFGHAAESALGEIEQYEGLLALVIVTVGLGFWLYRRHSIMRPAVDAG